MAKYIKQEMNDLHGEGKTKAYYRMKVQRNIATNELVKLMCAHRAGVSEGVIKAVIMQLTDEIAYQLADGRSVTIDGLSRHLPCYHWGEVRQGDGWHRRWSDTAQCLKS